jgi:hypothetical protein
LCVLLLSTVARAEGPTDRQKEEAATRFDRGVKLFEAQDYAAARAEFEAAYRLVPRYQVLFNIGVAEKKLFRYNDAVRTLKRYLDEGKANVPSDRRAAVERELGEIRALVAEVTIKVPGLPATVDIDGRSRFETPLTEPVLLGPGHHVVHATREGDEPADKEFEVVSGERVEVALTLTPKPKVPTTARLSVATRPPGAELIVDGKLAGREPWAATLDPGGHEIRATLKGYEKSRTELVLAAGQERALTVELVPLSPPPKWYKRWYTWTAVAVVAAGAVAAGVGGWYATHPTESFYALQFPK